MTSKHQLQYQPRALQSPLGALECVERLTFQRIDAQSTRWSARDEASLVRTILDHHLLNGDLLEYLIEHEEEVVDPLRARDLREIQEHLLGAYILLGTAGFHELHLAEVERCLAESYAVACRFGFCHLSAHARRLLCSGNYLRSQKNLELVRQLPRRRASRSLAAPVDARPDFNSN